MHLTNKRHLQKKNIFHEKKSKSCVGTLLTIATIAFIGIPAVMILAALALPSSSVPSFSACGGYARPEPEQYINSMNRAQQANHAEYGGFSNSMKALGIGLKDQTTNYKYSISATKNAAFSYAVSIRETKELTSYVGAVFLVPGSQAANKEKTTVFIMCKANSPGNTQPPDPILQNGNPVCAAGSSEVIK